MTNKHIGDCRKAFSLAIHELCCFVDMYNDLDNRLNRATVEAISDLVTGSSMNCISSKNKLEIQQLFKLMEFCKDCLWSNKEAVMLIRSLLNNNSQ